MVSGIQTPFGTRIRYKQLGAGMLDDDGSNIKHRHEWMEMVNLAYDGKQRPIWKTR